MDREALNYSPSSHNNEACSYPEDKFTGRFYVVDTAIIDDYFRVYQQLDTYQFTIVRDSAHRIKLTNFFNCNSDIYATVDTQVFYDINVITFCSGNISAGHFVMRGDSLHYDVDFGTGAFYEERWGLARRR